MQSNRIRGGKRCDQRDGRARARAPDRCTRALASRTYRKVVRTNQLDLHTSLCTTAHHPLSPSLYIESCRCALRGLPVPPRRSAARNEDRTLQQEERPLRFWETIENIENGHGAGGDSRNRTIARQRPRANQKSRAPPQRLKLRAPA